MCATWNIKVKAGDTLSKTLTFYDDTANTVPRDLRMYSEIAMQIRKKAGSAVIAQFTLGDGFTISGDDFNVLNLALLIPEGTEVGLYVHDIEFHVGAAIQTLVEGSVRVLPQITVL